MNFKFEMGLNIFAVLISCVAMISVFLSFDVTQTLLLVLCAQNILLIVQRNRDFDGD